MVTVMTLYFQYQYAKEVKKIYGTIHFIHHIITLYKFILHNMSKRPLSDTEKANLKRIQNDVGFFLIFKMK